MFQVGLFVSAFFKKSAFIIQKVLLDTGLTSSLGEGARIVSQNRKSRMSCCTRAGSDLASYHGGDGGEVRDGVWEAKQWPYAAHQVSLQGCEKSRKPSRHVDDHKDGATSSRARHIRDRSIRFSDNLAKCFDLSRFHDMLTADGIG